MPILPNEKIALNALKIELNKKYELLDLKIFGSKAKDLDTSESDLDVMVVLKNLTPLLESYIQHLKYQVFVIFFCTIFKSGTI